MNRSAMYSNEQKNVIYTAWNELSQAHTGMYIEINYRRSGDCGVSSLFISQSQ